MKDFIEKLIGRLEELITDTYYKSVDGSKSAGTENLAYHKVKKIVKQLEEEYNKNIEKSYISRTEVLKLIEDIKCNDSVPKNYGTLLDIMRQIRNMPTVSINNGWIPCSERLPEEFCKPVLAIDKDGIMWTAIYEYPSEEWFDDNYQRVLDVVAWQPLPPKYQPKGE